MVPNSHRLNFRLSVSHARCWRRHAFCFSVVLFVWFSAECELFGVEPRARRATVVAVLVGAQPPAKAVAAPIFAVHDDMNLQAGEPLGNLQLPLNDPVAQQIARELQPILIGELAFLRQICGNISTRDRRRIKAAAELALQDAAMRGSESRKQQDQQRRNRQRIMTVVAPISVLREGLARTVHENLPAELSDRYVAEAAHRIANRKRVVIGVIVSRLDDILYLTAAQRGEIRDSLNDYWVPDWEKWLHFSQPPPYVPAIPEGHLASLTFNQRSVWNSLQKVDPGALSHSSMRLQRDPWWEERAKTNPTSETVFRILRDRLE
jgi:hypothetical protein